MCFSLSNIKFLCFFLAFAPITNGMSLKNGNIQTIISGQFSVSLDHLKITAIPTTINGQINTTHGFFPFNNYSTDQVRSVGFPRTF